MKIKKVASLTINISLLLLASITTSPLWGMESDATSSREMLDKLINARDRIRTDSNYIEANYKDLEREFKLKQAQTGSDADYKIKLYYLCSEGKKLYENGVQILKELRTLRKEVDDKLKGEIDCVSDSLRDLKLNELGQKTPTTQFNQYVLNPVNDAVVIVLDQVVRSPETSKGSYLHLMISREEWNKNQGNVQLNTGNTTVQGSYPRMISRKEWKKEKDKMRQEKGEEIIQKDGDAETTDTIVQGVRYYHKGLNYLERNNAQQPQAKFFFRNNFTHSIWLKISGYSKDFFRHNNTYYSLWIKSKEQGRQCPINDKVFKLKAKETFCFTIGEADMPMKMVVWDARCYCPVNDETMMSFQGSNGIDIPLAKTNNTAKRYSIEHMEISSLEELRSMLKVGQDVNTFYLLFNRVSPTSNSYGKSFIIQAHYCIEEKPQVQREQVKEPDIRVQKKEPVEKQQPLELQAPSYMLCEAHNDLSNTLFFYNGLSQDINISLTSSDKVHTAKFSIAPTKIASVVYQKGDTVTGTWMMNEKEERFFGRFSIRGQCQLTKMIVANNGQQRILMSGHNSRDELYKEIYKLNPSSFNRD